MVWGNDEMPQLCPLRHLLAWISFMGIKEGHVFRSGTNVDAPMPYTTFNERLALIHLMCSALVSFGRVKKICREVCRRDGPWGTHTMRKTGYFMAVARKGDVVNIMGSARHKTYASAQRYYQDAQTVLTIAARDPESMDVINAMPPWTAIHIVNHNTSIAISNNQYSASDIPIIDMADTLVRSFVNHMDGPRGRRRLKPIDLAQAILKSAVPEQDVDLRLDSAINKVSDPQNRDELRQLVALKCVQFRTRLEVEHLDAVLVAQDAVRDASFVGGEQDVDMPGLNVDTPGLNVDTSRQGPVVTPPQIPDAVEQPCAPAVRREVAVLTTWASH